MPLSLTLKEIVVDNTLNQSGFSMAAGVFAHNSCKLVLADAILNTCKFLGAKCQWITGALQQSKVLLRLFKWLMIYLPSFFSFFFAVRSLLSKSNRCLNVDTFYKTTWYWSAIYPEVNTTFAPMLLHPAGGRKDYALFLHELFCFRFYFLRTNLRCANCKTNTKLGTC